MDVQTLTTFDNRTITSSGSCEDRGDLLLASQNWSQSTETCNNDFPYIDWLDVHSLLGMEYDGDPRKIHLVDRMNPSLTRADIGIGGLLLDILRSKGTTAEAVQSMLMVALGSRYQEHLFSRGRTGRKGQQNFSAQRANFVAVQIPGGQGRRANHAAEATQAYLIIVGSLNSHSITVCIIVIWYRKGMLTIVQQLQRKRMLKQLQ
jgi:hypothetical protein